MYRTIKRRCAETGRTYPWLMKSTAMVNHDYFYCVDKEFSPFYIKFRSYFPYKARLCLDCSICRYFLQKLGLVIGGNSVALPAVVLSPWLLFEETRDGANG